MDSRTAPYAVVLEVSVSAMDTAAFWDHDPTPTTKHHVPFLCTPCLTPPCNRVGALRIAYKENIPTVASAHSELS